MEGDIGVQLEATHRAGLGLAADDAAHRPGAAARAPAPSPRLHNADLTPTQAEGRTRGHNRIFARWAHDVHNLANDSFAIGAVLMRLKLTTPKVRTYAPPRAKRIVGWPGALG
ncbi:hypothetical protein WJ63_24580 [Burkholderia pyrrocinia]|nr:hypothetical protein WJ63_24580 [Burkholderia pyrrocinia]